MGKAFIFLDADKSALLGAKAQGDDRQKYKWQPDYALRPPRQITYK
jgi:hypothetical protein